MSKMQKLLIVLANAAKAGGGIHTTAELAFMLGEPCSPSFTKFLADGVKKGMLVRVVKGVYESALTPPEPDSAIFKIIKKMRSNVLNYISLESQLSYTGDISQVVMERVTVMTKGTHSIDPVMAEVSFYEGFFCIAQKSRIPNKSIPSC